MLQYIDDHLDSDLRVEQLAKQAGISYYRFNRIMHACFDKSLAFSKAFQRELGVAPVNIVPKKIWC